MEKKKKILTINFGGIGDEILFFPTLKTIKKVYPKSEITLVTEPRSAAAQNLTELVDNIITCDIKSKHKNIEIIKFLLKVWKNNYDIAFSAGSSKMVSILLFLTGIKEKYGYESGKLSKKILTKAIPLRKNQYAANMYNDLTSAINNDEKTDLPEVYVSQTSTYYMQNLIGEQNNDKKLVLIHPGVSKMSIKKNIVKFWSSENWINLIIKLLKENNYRVALVGGPDDKEIFTKIREEIESHNLTSDNLLDLYGKTKNIGHLAALIKMSDILVCVDSAPMHIAVGVKTPVAAIFGPTDEYKLLPVWDSRFTAIKNDTIECRPCLWDIRQESCEKLDCLNIPVEIVLDTINKKLSV